MPSLTAEAPYGASTKNASAKNARATVADTGTNRTERRHLLACYRREAKSDPRYRALSPDEQQVYIDRIGLMDRQGDIWLSQEKTLPHIRPLKGGRPSQTGHISKPTLNAKDAVLEASGLLAHKWSKGKKVSFYTPRTLTLHKTWNPGRTPPIKVWSLDRTIWRKAWARFKAWLESKLRRSTRLVLGRAFYTEKASANEPSHGRDSWGSPGQQPVGETGGGLVDELVAGGGTTLGDLWRSDPERYTAELAEIEPDSGLTQNRKLRGLLARLGEQSCGVCSGLVSRLLESLSRRVYMQILGRSPRAHLLSVSTEHDRAAPASRVSYLIKGRQNQASDLGCDRCRTHENLLMLRRMNSRRHPAPLRVPPMALQPRQSLLSQVRASVRSCYGLRGRRLATSERFTESTSESLPG
jgi:hypothetical protein